MSKGEGQIRQEIDKSGSPQSGEPVCLPIGKFHRTHGVKGEIILNIDSDLPTRIKAGTRICIGKERIEHIITSIRPADKYFLVSLEGFTDCDAVSIFRNKIVYIEKSALAPLPEGRFFHHEVIGMRVLDEMGNVVGSVREILVTGANDVYVITTPDEKEILIPSIKEVVLSIDRETQSMVVRLQKWD